MVLGYRGHADWRDMSDYVVHFTKGDTDDLSKETLARIIADGEVKAMTEVGLAKDMYMVEADQRCACFSEIPLDRLDRLVERRSRFGIGYRQELLLAQGGGRVWYVPRDTPLESQVDALKQRVVAAKDWNHPFWQVAPFIDRPGDYEGTPYWFEWEREWRVPGGFTFDPSQVAFTFMPRSTTAALVMSMCTSIRLGTSRGCRKHSGPLRSPQASRHRCPANERVVDPTDRRATRTCCLPAVCDGDALPRLQSVQRERIGERTHGRQVDRRTRGRRRDSRARGW
jgi:hypothetical protein